MKSLMKTFPDCLFKGQNKVSVNAKLHFCEIENCKIYDDVELKDIVIKNAIVKKNNYKNLKNNIFCEKYFYFLKNYDNNLFDGIKILVSCDSAEVREFIKNLFQTLHADVFFVEDPVELPKQILKIKGDIAFWLFDSGRKLFAFNARGEKLDGDEILYLLAWQVLGQNSRGKVVLGTQKTNLGIENKLRALGVKLERLKSFQNFGLSCQDKKVCLGATQDGQIYLPDTKECAVLASRILASVFLENKNIWEKVKENRYVQVEKNIEIALYGKPLSNEIVKTFMGFYGLKLKNQGRVLIWQESKYIHILVESIEKTTALILATDIKRKLLRVLKSGGL